MQMITGELCRSWSPRLPASCRASATAFPIRSTWASGNLSACTTAATCRPDWTSLPRRVDGENEARSCHPGYCALRRVSPSDMITSPEPHQAAEALCPIAPLAVLANTTVSCLNCASGQFRPCTAPSDQLRHQMFIARLSRQLWLPSVSQEDDLLRIGSVR